MTNQKFSSTKIGSGSWKSLITSGAEEMGIPANDAQVGMICRYAETLVDWNRKVNLTAITDPEGVAVKHFLDSMAALPYVPESGTLLDIGSGGGFPGIVIAIFRPSLKITSIDSVRKKISFQQYVINLLGLGNVRALHARAEKLPGLSEGTSFDIVVSRALGSLDLIAQYAIPVLGREGTIIAYKGTPEAEESLEMEGLAKSLGVPLSVDCHQYRLPVYGDRRCLFVVKKEC